MNNESKKIVQWLNMPLLTALMWLALFVSAVLSIIYLLHLTGLIAVVVRDVLGITRDTANAAGAIPSISLVTFVLCAVTFLLGKRQFKRRSRNPA
jgi:hypothetical protein